MEDAEAARGTSSRSVRLLRWPPRLLRTLARVIPQAVDHYFADRCGQLAAGIAYRVLFSLVPLAIVLVAIFGFVLRNEKLRNDVIGEIVGALPLSPSGGADVTRAIEKLASPATTLGLVSLLVFGWAATGMMSSIRAGLEVAMHVERGRPAVRGKLVDVILIVGAGALVLGVVFLNLAKEVIFASVQRPLHWIGLDGGPLEQLVRYGVPPLLTTGVVLLLYRFVPARRLKLGDALAGAIVTALILLGISLVSGILVARVHRLSISAIYSGLTSALVFLYSVYLYASALLLGAEVAVAWSGPADLTDEPLSGQLRRALLGLFVRQDPPPRTRERRRLPTDPGV